MWRLLAPGLLALGAVHVAVGHSLGAPQESKRKGTKTQESDPTWVQEADRVVQDAERQAREREAAEERVAEHFLLCDLNANGWISFREGQATLGLDRLQFQRYDENRDGRIDVDEFRARDEALLTLLGAVPTPKSKTPEAPEGEEEAEGEPVRQYDTSTDASQLRFAVVVARFNQLVSGKLLEGCTEELCRRGANPDDIEMSIFDGTASSFNSELSSRKKTSGRIP